MPMDLPCLTSIGNTTKTLKCAWELICHTHQLPCPWVLCPTCRFVCLWIQPAHIQTRAAVWVCAEPGSAFSLPSILKITLCNNNPWHSIYTPVEVLSNLEVTRGRGGLRQAVCRYEQPFFFFRGNLNILEFGYVWHPRTSSPGHQAEAAYGMSFVGIAHCTLVLRTTLLSSFGVHSLWDLVRACKPLYPTTNHPGGNRKQKLKCWTLLTQVTY